MRKSVKALLPIRPKYANAILNGLKTVEFRRRSFKENVDCILIYASSPVMSLVGYFEIDSIEETTPTVAWKKFGSKGCINKEDYQNYYEGSDLAVTIKIRKAVKFDEPVRLDAISKGIKPPQSYRYLADEQFDRVLKLAC